MEPMVFQNELWSHRATLTHFARRFGLDADDLVQETFVRAYLARSRFRPGSNGRAWLHRILEHAAISELRREGSRRRLEASYQIDGPLAPDEEPAQSIDPLKSALERLGEKERAVVELRFYAGLRYREIAALKGIPIGTVMSRLHRAQRKLRNVLYPSQACQGPGESWAQTARRP